MTKDKKPSPVEEFKESSNFLRGEIAAELEQETDHFSTGSMQLLKHHGTYQHDDRDERLANRAAGKADKRYMLMLRTRIPGGKLTPAQLLAELDLCDEIGNGTLRLTSRQALQLHGILKSDLRTTIRRINDVHLSTIAACGDVNRNVMCCPVPYATEVHRALQSLAQELTDHFTPRTRAYHDLWLRDLDNGEKQLVEGGELVTEEEPIYGRTYLPRKFKIGIALPHDNCIDIYTHDLGLLGIVERDQIVGYNVLVGGGFGVTPSNKRTFPALAQKLCFVTPDQVIGVAEAVVKVQRDFGDRTDRKVARLKYLIHRWGIAAFRAKVAEYYGQDLAEPHADDVHEAPDHIGWESQGDGKWFYGLNIENGRLADNSSMQLKKAIRHICTEFSIGLRLTAHQSILLTDIADDDRAKIETVLRDHGVPLSNEVSTVRRWSMACVAWPTCGLAITESERALPALIDQLESVLQGLGLEQEKFTIRMTGCPNGCARPYNADVGIVGKAKGRYTLFLGGSRIGTRLNFIYKDLVPGEEIVATLTPIFTYYRQERTEGESFGDFCARKGGEDLAAWAESWHGEARP